MYRLNFDEMSGILEVTVVGFLSPEIGERFARDFEIAIVAARARDGGLKMLIDAALGTVLIPEVAHRMKRLEQEFVDQPSDRVAVIVGSSAQKHQVRDLFDASRTQAFLSPHAAQTWLLAYTPQPEPARDWTCPWLGGLSATAANDCTAPPRIDFCPDRAMCAPPPSGGSRPRQLVTGICRS